MKIADFLFFSIKSRHIFAIKKATSVAYFFNKEMSASTAHIMHHVDHTYKSVNTVPAPVNPIKAAIANRTIKAISPFFDPFLVTIETIPPAIMKIETSIPAEPLVSPFSANAFAAPAAHD